jgi:TatD DNase family protein
MILVDSHCHLNDDALFSSRDELIKKSIEHNVKYFLCVGWDVESSKKAIQIAHEYNDVYAAVGLHPENLDGVDDNSLRIIKELAKDPKVKAIGEIGLDYHYFKDGQVRAKQKEWFIKQIELANELSLPVSIHARDASQDTYDILKSHPLKQKGVLHCYSGSLEIMKLLIPLGFYFGFDGPITFKNAQEPVKNVIACPLDRLLTETDSPYLTPVPFRGTTNNPSHICEIIQKMAELRSVNENTLADQVLNNFKNLFHVER